MLLVAGTLAAACTYTSPSQPSDATEPDGTITPSCDAPTLACSDDSLRASCPGAADVLIPCRWGCREDGTGPRCGELVPAGGAVTPDDLDPTDLGDFMLAGTIDGGNGEINGAPTPAGVGFRQAGNVAIFRFRSLQITGALRLLGNRAIAFVASGDIVIDGVIDARGPCGDGNGQAAGPGGGNGGNEANGQGPGAGSGDDLSNEGAGGAGHGALGGTGGGGFSGGGAVGNPQITTLLGGAGGGGGKTSRGGGGGGAIQIVSDSAITILAIAGINAGGCGGVGGDGNADAAGGGGGAGGTILLEAPVITIAGTIAVNGGAGGNRDNGDGNAGRLDRTRSTAPTGGGRGGAGGDFAGETGTGAGDDQTNGGGGGAVGRIRFNTGTGVVTELGVTGATLSPDLADGPLTTTTHAAANTR